MNKIVSGGLAALVLSLGGCGDSYPVQPAKTILIEERALKLSLPLIDPPFDARIDYYSDYNESRKTYTGIFLSIPKYYVQSLGDRYSRMRIRFPEHSDYTPMVIDLDTANKKENMRIITNLNEIIESDEQIIIEGKTPLGDEELIYSGPMNAEQIEKQVRGFSY